MGVFPTLILKPTSQIPTAGLVAEYLANNNFLDTSGNGYNGVNNNVTFGTDRKSQANSAFVFNGTNAFVDIDASLAGLSTNTKGTFSAWVKMIDATPPEQENFISFGDTNANEFIAYYFPSTKIRAAIIDGGSVKWALDPNGSGIFSDVWYHIALVQDGVSPVIYIDSVAIPQAFVASADKTIWFNDTTGIDNGRLGCLNSNSNGNAAYFDGSIDDIRIYDRALSQEEITILANE